MKVLNLKSELALETRAESQISNEIYRGPTPHGDLLHSEDLRKEYRTETHRSTRASRKYNCHGLTFASRRTLIDLSQEVAKSLVEDGYIEIPYNRVEPGDIAIYYKDGDLEHSGVVMKISDLKVPYVLSKWGFAHEVIHHIARCPYDSNNVKYFRIES